MTTPKLYSKEERPDIVDYDDDDFMRNLYFRDHGFHVNYEMWMARKKHDGTWTAADETIEKKRRAKMDKAFPRYQEEHDAEYREHVLDHLVSAAAEPRARSGRKPGWWHRKTGHPFPLVGKMRTLIGRGRRTRRRKRRRRRTRRGGKFIFDYIKKQVQKDEGKRRHRAAERGWHHRLEYPTYVHTLPRKTATHKPSRRMRHKIKRVSVTPRRLRSYTYPRRTKRRKKMERVDRTDRPKWWATSRRKYKVKKSKKSKKSKKKQKKQ